MSKEVNDKLKREENKKQLLSLSFDSFEKETTSSNIEESLISVNEAFDDYKKVFESSQEVIDPKVIPISSRIVTTARLMNVMELKGRMSKEELDLNLFENLKTSVSDVQVVVAKGPGAKQIEVGDVVKISIQDFVRMKNPGGVNRQEVFDLPLEKINGREYLTVHENNIKYIYKN